jgi:hypothetical protein
MLVGNQISARICRIRKIRGNYCTYIDDSKVQKYINNFLRGAASTIGDVLRHHPSDTTAALGKDAPRARLRYEQTDTRSAILKTLRPLKAQNSNLTHSETFS